MGNFSAKFPRFREGHFQLYQFGAHWVHTYFRVGYDDHDVSIGREQVNDDRVVGVFDLHRLKRRIKLAAAQLELFDYVADLLEALQVIVVLFEAVRYDEKCGLLEKQYFVGFDHVGEVFEALLQLRSIQYELVHYLGPSLKRENVYFD